MGRRNVLKQQLRAKNYHTSMAELTKAHKKNFIANASKAELAVLVTDSLEQSRIEEANNFKKAVKITHQQPGDFGTRSSTLINYAMQQPGRFEDQSKKGPHAGRFEVIPTDMEKLSHHRSQRFVSFDRFAKRYNIFEENKYLERGAGRKERPASKCGNFYDTPGSKVYAMNRLDVIVPDFKKTPYRPSQVIAHDYPFADVDTDPCTEKRKATMRRSKEPISYMKTRGREDNMVYKLNEGYNLERKDKTFFDQHNVMEMLIHSRKLRGLPTVHYESIVERE